MIYIRYNKIAIYAVPIVVKFSTILFLCKQIFIIRISIVKSTFIVNEKIRRNFFFISGKFYLNTLATNTNIEKNNKLTNSRRKLQLFRFV